MNNKIEQVCISISYVLGTAYTHTDIKIATSLFDFANSYVTSTASGHNFASLLESQW